MIIYFVHELNQRPARRLVTTARRELPQIRIVTYQSAFRALSFPAGTLMFSDFEFLNGFELMAAAEMAEAALAANASTQILNHPARACERFVLLRRLHAAGVNPTEVTRLDAGERPTRYPVFVRLEDGCWGAETPILQDGEELERALAAFRTGARPMKRRIAVSFEGESDPDGYHRKYGAFRIGAAIVPQHILRSSGWSVKSGRNEYDPRFLSEELAFVRDNPHQDHLLRVADLGDLQFGRIDYGFAGGRPVVYEINTNPTFPRFHGGNPDREERRGIILERLRAAFQAIDSHETTRARIRFTPHVHAQRYIQLHRWGPLRRGLWRLKLLLKGGAAKPERPEGT